MSGFQFKKEPLISPTHKFTPEQAQAVADRIGIRWDEVDYDPDQFRRGMDVELEHGTRDPLTNVTNDDPILTGKIAWAHLREIPDYYDRLEAMEKAAGGGNSR